LADSDEFFANVPHRGHSPTSEVQLVPSRTMLGPTTAEFDMKRAKEIREIKAGRKWKSTRDASGGKVTSSKSARAYSAEEQAHMYVMRVSIQHTYTARAPWAIDQDDVIKRAKEFAKEFSTCQAENMVTEDFAKTVSPLSPFLTLYPESNTVS
jgi:hypothetical protein